MAEERIDLGGLPHGQPGPYDTVAGVDIATGEARQFPMPQAGVPRSYSTRASLPSASGFTEGYTVWVNNDPTPANNGTWAVLGGTWVKSADRVSGLEGSVAALGNDIDLVAEEVARVDERTSALRSVDDTPIAAFVDRDGDVVAELDAAGGLHLPGLTGSVQEEFDAIPAELAGVMGSPDDIATFVEGDEVVARIRPEVGVQVARRTPVVPTRTPRDHFHASARPYLEALRNSGHPEVAPCPLTLLPHSHTVPDSIIHGFTLPPTPRLTIDTPYFKDDGVVHPYVVEFYGQFRGYRYMMAINPYSSNQHENPVIYGTDDLENFDLLPYMEQPLGGPPAYGYCSDSGFAYNLPTGELVCYWRETYTVPPATSTVRGTAWVYRSTRNGIDWTPKRFIREEVPDSVEGVTSPAILYSPLDHQWHAWYVPSPGQIRHITAPTIEGPWEVVSPRATGTTVNAWHIEVKWIGDKFVMLINRRDPLSNLYLAISSDGDSWTFSTSPLFATQLVGIYKASFCPVYFDDGTMALDIVWTTNIGTDSEDTKRLYSSRTNAVAI